MQEETPWLPSPRRVDHTWMSLKDYHSRQTKMLEEKQQANPHLVFLGDSITEGWRDAGGGVWQKFWQPRRSLCLGLGGDQTQNLLWRLSQGELQGIDPRVIVLTIGVNNLWWGGFTPEQTAKGVLAVVSEIQRQLPQAQLILHGILPASRSRNDDLRKRIAQCNEILRTWSTETSHGFIQWLDLTQTFTGIDGMIDPKVMADYLHLTSHGYRLWAEALAPWIDKFMV